MSVQPNAPNADPAPSPMTQTKNATVIIISCEPHTLGNFHNLAGDGIWKSRRLNHDNIIFDSTVDRLDSSSQDSGHILCPDTNLPCRCKSFEKTLYRMTTKSLLRGARPLCLVPYSDRWIHCWSVFHRVSIFMITARMLNRWSKNVEVASRFSDHKISAESKAVCRT